MRSARLSKKYEQVAPIGLEPLLMLYQHNRYALYHPSAEALSSMIVDLPYKIINSIVVNSTLYCELLQGGVPLRSILIVALSHV
jgi:hypothetical protein